MPFGAKSKSNNFRFNHLFTNNMQSAAHIPNICKSPVPLEMEQDSEWLMQRCGQIALCAGGDGHNID